MQHTGSRRAVAACQRRQQGIRQVAGKLQRVDLRQKEVRDDMKAVSGTGSRSTPTSTSTSSDASS